MNTMGDALGIAPGGGESKKAKAMGKVVSDSYQAGMDAEGLNKVTRQLIDSTNDWATALNEVAEAAKRVGENMGAEGAGPVENPTALGGFGQGQEIQLVLEDGYEFRAYLRGARNSDALEHMR